MEVGDDLRQGRADHRLVERAEEDAHHDPAEDAQADGMGEFDRRAIRQSGPGLGCWLSCRVGHREHLSFGWGGCPETSRPLGLICS